MEGLCFKPRMIHGIHSFGGGVNGVGNVDGRTHTAHVSALGRSSSSASISSDSTTVDGFSFAKPLKSLWTRGGGGGENGADQENLDDKNGIFLITEEEEEEAEEEEEEEEEGEIEGENEPIRTEEQRGNWVLKILQIRSLWRSKTEKDYKKEEDLSANGGEEFGNCSCSQDQRSEIAQEEIVEFDRDSFSKLLRKVTLSEAKLYAQMSYLGKLAYSIPKIKPENLLRHKGLRFVTSSLEIKANSIEAIGKPNSGDVQDAEPRVENEAKEEEDKKKKRGYIVTPSIAYHMAASAASYLQSRIPFKSSKSETKEESSGGSNGTREETVLTSAEVASFVATTNSLTAVVAAKEEMKQAVAKDLNSLHTSPCEWFVCDDDQSGTRFFVIQGSESLASWQANLLFEPVRFEGLDVLVHRGIYEAAKGIYEQMLPEVRAHLKTCGDSATFRFTGHSLGGSLSLLINIMLLLRGEVPLSSLLPVITFGAPSIMCGGDQLLRRLGLPRSHLQAITLHRDIVPRAFSCSYPDHVVRILKAVNRNFRNHPCLTNQKLLYAPMGEILILQPDEKHSPHHHLLPSGSGLYLLSCPLLDSKDAEKQLQAAKNVFINSPHPLEILSDRSAYGSDGAIYRDHDMNSYLGSVRNVIHQELNQLRKSRRERRRQSWWTLIAPSGNNEGISESREVAQSNFSDHQIRFSVIFKTGRESLKRLSRFVASQNIHLLMVLLFPARLLTYAVVYFR